MKYIELLSIFLLFAASSPAQSSAAGADVENTQKNVVQSVDSKDKTGEQTAETKKNASTVTDKKSDTTSTTNTGSTDGKSGSTREFAGLRFGVGLSLTIDSGTRQRVETAELVNGVVRITNENDALARIMLESHYFFTPGFDFGLDTDRSAFGVKAGSWGWGPFVSVQPGSNEIIEAIGFGLMLGFKRNGDTADPDSSWNIGVGYVVDPNVQVLGDGISANDVLPEGEDAIRYKEVSQSGFLVLISFSF